MNPNWCAKWTIPGDEGSSAPTLVLTRLSIAVAVYSPETVWAAQTVDHGMSPVYAAKFHGPVEAVVDATKDGFVAVVDATKDGFADPVGLAFRPLNDWPETWGDVWDIPGDHLTSRNVTSFTIERSTVFADSWVGRYRPSGSCPPPLSEHVGYEFRSPSQALNAAIDDEFVPQGSGTGPGHNDVNALLPR